MAKIIEYRDIPLDDLEIGKGQVRTQDLGKEIEELADSIKKQGLLQPIVVCKGQSPDKWEILTGQRRFLACKQLRMNTIAAAVMDEQVEESEAKAISITENLIRRQLSGKELIDGIAFLYNLYGSAKDVAQATGLPYAKILKYIKYPRLLPQLKKIVDDGTVDINTALKAQDASENDAGKASPDVAVKLASEMVQMTGIQQKNLVNERKKYPDKPVEDLLEYAKSGSRITQIVVSITQDTNDAITRYARENDYKTKDEATTELIEDSLKRSGFLEE